jgi:hypothetical protein
MSGLIERRAARSPVTGNVRIVATHYSVMRSRAARTTFMPVAGALIGGQNQLLMARMGTRLTAG